jgi:ADP-ribose pyrophosphatase
MLIKKIEQLTNEKWLNLFAATFDHNTHTGRWVYASRNPQPSPQASSPPSGTKKMEKKADAVIVVPILCEENESPRLVMVEEFRVPIGDYIFGFPAGLLDGDESIEEAARRELLEETGLEIVAVQRVSQPLFSSSGLSDETVAMAFVTARRSHHAKPSLEASEDLRVILLDFPEVCRLCNNGSANLDARAWMVLYFYQQLGCLR